MSVTVKVWRKLCIFETHLLRINKNIILLEDVKNSIHSSVEWWSAWKNIKLKIHNVKWLLNVLEPWCKAGSLQKIEKFLSVIV